MAKETNKSSKEVKDKKENKNFFKEFKAELKRVSWPTFKQLVNNTTAVIAIVLITAAIVFVLDVIFKSLNSYGVDKLKALVTSSSSETSESEDAEVNEEAIDENSSDEDGITLDVDNQTDSNSVEENTELPVEESTETNETVENSVE